MGEEKQAAEEKKMEEKKMEEGKKPTATEEVKKEEKPMQQNAPAASKKQQEGEAKDSKEEPTPTPTLPPPPQEIVLKVYMHCEGCARKVRRCLKGFAGVEDVSTDCKSSKVVVKGEKADPLKVLERVQMKSHRQVELISPVPKPPSAEEDEEKKKVVEEEKQKPPPEEKKDEPQVFTTVLRVYMHCEACAMEIKKRIQRMKGVESAEPDLKSSEVKVVGIYDPQKLVQYVYKRTGKHAVIMKQESEKKEQEEKGKEEKKEENGDAKNQEKKEGEGEANKDNNATTEVVELKRNEYYYYPPRYAMEYYAYPPQIFSDENPNACSVM